MYPILPWGEGQGSPEKLPGGDPGEESPKSG